MALTASGTAIAADSQAPAAPARDLTPSPLRVHDTRRPAPPLWRIEGTYQVVGGSGTIRVKWLGGDVLSLLATTGWESAGLLEGAVFCGAIREDGSRRFGQLVVDWGDTDRVLADIEWFPVPSTTPLVQRWRRVDSSSGPVDSPPEPEPAFGEYVYVEQLPEAIVKVPPAYPEAARQANAEGTVLVQALVRKDGTVGETKIVKSIPELNEAAMAAVRQWRFKPATAKGLPVAVWVAIPVKFTLH